MTETTFGNWEVHEACIIGKLVIKEGMRKVPDGPGIGVTVNEATLKDARMPGEPWGG